MKKIILLMIVIILSGCMTTKKYLPGHYHKKQPTFTVLSDFNYSSYTLSNQAEKALLQLNQRVVLRPSLEVIQKSVADAFSNEIVESYLSYGNIETDYIMTISTNPYGGECRIKIIRSRDSRILTSFQHDTYSMNSLTREIERKLRSIELKPDRKEYDKKNKQVLYTSRKNIRVLNHEFKEKPTFTVFSNYSDYTSSQTVADIEERLLSYKLVLKTPPVLKKIEKKATKTSQFEYVESKTVMNYSYSDIKSDLYILVFEKHIKLIKNDTNEILFSSELQNPDDLLYILRAAGVEIEYIQKEQNYKSHFLLQ